MSLWKLSAKTSSASIYDFTISFWSCGQSVVHCIGSELDDGQMARETRRRWHFLRPILPIVNWRQSRQASSPDNCPMHCPNSPSQDSTPGYSLYSPPVTIDACLQATSISSTGGNPDAFRSYVFVFISRCRIQKPSIGYNESQGTIHAHSERTGVTILRAECILGDEKGLLVVEMEGVKLSRYTGRIVQNQTSIDPHLERHPVLRLAWKPDIIRLEPEAKS
ncbi:hypothetical protein F4859DRAFT_529854 [Xylaria cf. heliscus]|nr:hypothetical protein F4859DRAFT_529854 [Xylaria cf. heliscus]